MSILWGGGSSHGSKPKSYWKEVGCPECKAAPGQHCMMPSLSKRPYHSERGDAYIALRQQRRTQEVRECLR